MTMAAVIQMNGTADAGTNWLQAEDLVGRAAAAGARLVATPENTNFLGPPAEKARTAEPLEGPTCGRFSELARRLGIFLLLGSFNERSEAPGKCRNTSVLFGPDGERLAVYRKLHLFDVDVNESVSVRESDAVEPGDRVVVVETSVGRLGLSICYDLRFGNLYSRMAREGAEILCVPSAFTMTTGRDHWEPLLRARAIECQAYVLAPAQVGRHEGADLRESYGHAMIVDPWGLVVARASDGPGLALAEIDLRRVREIRKAIPVADHFRPEL